VRACHCTLQRRLQDYIAVHSGNVKSSSDAVEAELGRVRKQLEDSVATAAGLAEKNAELTQVRLRVLAAATPPRTVLARAARAAGALPLQRSVAMVVRACVDVQAVEALRKEVAELRARADDATSTSTSALSQLEARATAAEVRIEPCHVAAGVSTSSTMNTRAVSCAPCAISGACCDRARWKGGRTQQDCGLSACARVTLRVVS
jgi:hypothetical protein